MVSFDQLKMTNHVLCKITDLYFEDDQSLATKLLIASKQCGQLGQVPQPRLVMLTLAGSPLKVLLNTTQKIKCHKEVGHLQSAGCSSYKVPGRST